MSKVSDQDDKNPMEEIPLLQKNLKKDSEFYDDIQIPYKNSLHI